MPIRDFRVRNGPGLLATAPQACYRVWGVSRACETKDDLSPLGKEKLTIVLAILQDCSSIPVIITAQAVSKLGFRDRPGRAAARIRVAEEQPLWVRSKPARHA